MSDIFVGMTRATHHDRMSMALAQPVGTDTVIYNHWGLAMAAKCHIRRRSMLLGAAATAAVGQDSSIGYAQEQRLASWNDGAAKQAILDFVRTTTSQVPPEDRIATFDQDGTLWVEHPVYSQAIFALERRTRWLHNILTGAIGNHSRPCLSMIKRR